MHRRLHFCYEEFFIHTTIPYSKLNYQHFEIANLHLKQLQNFNFLQLDYLKANKFFSPKKIPNQANFNESKTKLKVRLLN